MSASSQITLILLYSSIFVTVVVASDTVTPTNPLSGDHTLVSSGGNFALGFFSPPNSNSRYVGIWYNTIPIQTVAWVANRAAPADSAAALSISPSGSLSVTSNGSNGHSLWSTPSSALTNPVAKLLDNGNLVVKEAGAGDDGGFAWQSFDHPTDTLMAGMELGTDFRTGATRNLTSWSAADDPAVGEYTIAFDVRGSPEIFLYSGGAAGGTKLWRTGPWNGLRFSGIPETTSYQNFSFSFISNQDEVSYSFDTDPTIVSRLVVNGTGVVQRSLWIPGAGGAGGVWNFFWFAPKDQCDNMAACGPYGACDPNGSPICSCLQGFDPRFPANWELRDGSGGCKRRTALDCRNGTDGFVRVAGAKLPDTTKCTVDASAWGLDECRSECLKNCSCVAYAVANVSVGGAGSVCVFWFSELLDIRIYTGAGQDLYVRLAAVDVGSTTSQSHKSQHTTIAITVSLVAGTLLLTSVGCYLLKKKRRRTGVLGRTPSTIHYNDESNRRNDLELPLFDMDTIVTATNNFSLGNKLGEGGFGPVYKGNLEDLQEIAVKRLAKTSVQGLDEFKNEVMLIAKLQHRNLVRLLGCCVQGAERMLIYEYMPNRSLDAFLFDKARATLLDWQTRYNIIIGIARGLVYLHHDSRFKIIHRDLKASNILLDKEMNPKISDFGMARIFGGDEIEASTRKVVGTYGYMSPEYAMDGIFSMKSDVFSFGVLVLEIISGKKNRGVYYASTHVNLLGHAWSLWNEGNSLELVEKSVGHTYNLDEVLKCIKVGLLCVQQRPEDRPLMSSVVLMLGNEDASLPSPKQPGFVAKRAPFETDSSSSKQESCTVNDMTFTTVEGR